MFVELAVHNNMQSKLVDSQHQAAAMAVFGDKSTTQQ